MIIIFKKIILDGEITRWSINEEGIVRNDETNQFLKGSLLHSYRYINFRWNKKQKNKAVHRLVAETFIPNPHNLPYVHHIDGNRENNNIKNLQWVDAKTNRYFSKPSKKFFRYDNQEIENEIWINFRNFHYEVSNFGRVRNTITNKILKGNKSDCGYIRVELETPNGTRKKFLVHRMVYEAFKDNNFIEINHIDGNKINNKLSNLESVSHKENMQKATYETNAWNFRKVGKFNLNGELLKIYSNASEAARDINILPSSLRNAIRLRNGRCQNFIFKYLENK